MFFVFLWGSEQSVFVWKHLISDGSVTVESDESIVVLLQFILRNCNLWDAPERTEGKKFGACTNMKSISQVFFVESLRLKRKVTPWSHHHHKGMPNFSEYIP